MARVMRKSESRRSNKQKFHRGSKPHSMNQVRSFVAGRGVHRGGVQA